MDRAARKDIPAGAKILTRPEALDYLWGKLYEHKPVRDVIALKYGSLTAGGLASLSGFFILRHFRQQLGLRKEAAISSNLACIFLPCMGTFFYHFAFVTPPIILQERYCQICLELKSAALQNAVGFMWPMGLGLVSASMTATKLGVHMPSMMQPIKLIKLGWHMAKQGDGPKKFTGLLVCNTIGAVVLVHAEEAEVMTFKRRLLIRRELDKD